MSTNPPTLIRKYGLKLNIKLITFKAINNKQAINIAFCTLLQRASIYNLSLGRQSKFHADTNQSVKLYRVIVKSSKSDKHAAREVPIFLVRCTFMKASHGFVKFYILRCFWLSPATLCDIYLLPYLSYLVWITKLRKIPKWEAETIRIIYYTLCVSVNTMYVCYCYSKKY